MGDPMFQLDTELAQQIFDYCRERLSENPVPLASLAYATYK